MPLLRKDRRVFLILLVAKTVVYLGCLCSHWRINNDRQDGDPFRFFKFADRVQHLLSSADGKCRYQDRRTSACGFIYDLCKLIRRRFISVKPIAVCGLARQVVASRRRSWIFENRLVIVPEITRK